MCIRDRYKYLNIPCIPVALNSGLFWQTKGYEKKKGVIQVEFLEGIKPGLKKHDFQILLKNKIESATKKLIEKNRDE